MSSNCWIVRIWEKIAGPGWKWPQVLLCLVPTFALAVLFLLYAHQKDLGWSVLQNAVAFLLVVNVVGGAILVYTPQAKFYYHRSGRTSYDLFFSNAIQVQPLIVAWFFYPKMDWEFGFCVYGLMMVSTVVILKVPRIYKGIIAAFIVVMGCRVFEIFDAPPELFWWFEPVYYMKLLLGHLVPLVATKEGTTSA